MDINESDQLVAARAQTFAERLAHATRAADDGQ
jgi:hypothetical protein